MKRENVYFIFGFSTHEICIFRFKRRNKWHIHSKNLNIFYILVYVIVQASFSLILPQAPKTDFLVKAHMDFFNRTKITAVFRLYNVQINFQESDKEDRRSSSRSPSRSHERRSTEGSNEGGENLMQHCTAFSEMFYQCYVKGIIFHILEDGQV